MLPLDALRLLVSFCYPGTTLVVAARWAQTLVHEALGPLRRTLREWHVVPRGEPWHSWATYAAMRAHLGATKMLLRGARGHAALPCVERFFFRRVRFHRVDKHESASWPRVARAVVALGGAHCVLEIERPPGALDPPVGTDPRHPLRYHRVTCDLHTGPLRDAEGAPCTYAEVQYHPGGADPHAVGHCAGETDATGRCSGFDEHQLLVATDVRRAAPLMVSRMCLFRARGFSGTIVRGCVRPAWVDVPMGFRLQGWR